MLQFQLRCCIAQLHCNTSAFVIKAKATYLLSYLLTLKILPTAINA